MLTRKGSKLVERELLASRGGNQKLFKGGKLNPNITFRDDTPTDGRPLVPLRQTALEFAAARRLEIEAQQTNGHAHVNGDATEHAPVINGGANGHAIHVAPVEPVAVNGRLRAGIARLTSFVTTKVRGASSPAPIA